MFIAITKLSFTSEVKDMVLDIADRSRPVFKQQPGFISLQGYLSHDKEQLLTVLEWEKQADHEQCMGSPDWEDVNKSWAELMATGKAKFELNTFEKYPDRT